MLSSIDSPNVRRKSSAKLETSGPTSVLFGIKRLATAESEELGGQFGAVLHRILRFPQHLALTGVVEAGLEHFEIASDDCQQVVEVVGDAPGELADRLHLLRLPKLRLHLPTRRQIANEPGKDAFAAGSRLADRQLHGKDCAILRQAFDHAAVTDDPGLPGFQIPADVAVMFFPVRSRHQHLDVAANDLVGVIAEQLRRRRAERGHDPAFVDDDHRLRDRIEDRAQMRLAGGQLSLGPFQFSDVAVDLEDRLEFALFGRPRDPKARNRDLRAVFPLLFNFALPASALAHLLDDFVARQGIAGLQKLVDEGSERFLAAPTVKALASGGPDAGPCPARHG